MLTIDYANCLADRVGPHGLDPALIAPGSALAHAAAHLTERLAATRGTGWERWRDLARNPMRGEHLEAVKAIAGECRGKYENMVVLGIGGSALGNIALQAALNPPTYNLLSGVGRAGPRLFVLDNVDPMHVGAVLGACERLGGIEKTLFNVISKSGETAETAAQFMIVRDMLRGRLGERARDNIVAITDPSKGTMRAICDREGYRTLPVPDGVGGRFSVLSPVGLFSAAMCGIDAEALLDGADEMDRRCCVADLGRNPAAMLAALLVELGTNKGKPNHVMMPYSNALYLLADWFRQLWAESLGKQTDVNGQTVYAGFTPIKALGATDQHSQVQLYREGPNDKVFGIVQIDDFTTGVGGGLGSGSARGNGGGGGASGTGVSGSGKDLTIPTGLGIDATAYLEGKTLGGLLNAEKRATEYALVESQRPNFTIRFPRLDARHVGEFIMLWQIATAYAGLMLNVDAYDQPAVETGKRATFGLMGRKGFEEWNERVNRALAPTNRVI